MAILCRSPGFSHSAGRHRGGQSVRPKLRAFRQWSITQKIVVAFFAVILVPVGVAGYVVYQQLVHAAVEQERATLVRGIALARQSAQAKAQELDRVTQLIATNQKINTFLDAPFEWLPNVYEEYLFLIAPYIENLKFQVKSVNDLRVYYDEPSIPERWGGFYNMSRIADSPWLRALYPDVSRAPVWRMQHLERVFGPLGERDGVREVFSMYREIYSLVSGKRIALIEAEIATADLFEALQVALPNDQGRYFIFAPDGTVLVDSATGTAETSLDRALRLEMERNDAADWDRLVDINGRETIVVSAGVPPLGVRLIAVYPTDHAVASIATSLVSVGLVTLGIFAAIMVITRVVIGVLMKRLRLLVAAMRQAGGGDLSVVVPVPAMDEFGELASSFNAMLRRIQGLIDTLYKTELMEKRAELAALEAQINPHFLYNSLSAITWAARRERNGEIEAVSLALSRFYRMMLNRGQSQIRVGDELDMLKAYLTVQAMRFRDRYKIAYEIEEGIENYSMPRVVLQPLVENALKHGLESRRGGGTVTVAAWTEDGRLNFQVRDDGVGIKADLLARINEGKVEGSAGSGYAIKNIDERIKLAYGSAYGLFVSSEEGIGTTVTVSLPLAGENAGMKEQVDHV